MTGPVRTLLHVFPGFTTGGAQMRFVQLANRFGSAYRHRIVSLNGNTDAFARLAPGLDASRVDVPVQRGDFWHNLRRFRQTLAAERPDLLVTSNWGSIEWALANLTVGVPHLHLEDGFGPEEAQRQLPRRVWTRRLVLRRSTVILPSRKLFALARDVWRLPAARLHYLPNGVDGDRFASGFDPAFAATHGLGPGEPLIGTVAALRAEKNLGRLIDAFAQVSRQRPARLVIVGDGPERPALTARAAALGIGDRVLFTGPVATPEKLLAAFSLFALSSDTEQMPLSVLEAMAAGLPQAATNVGDVATMVAEENRRFVVAPDATALAGAMLALLADPAAAAAIGAANQRRARQDFDQTRMFAAYRRLFDGGALPPSPLATPAHPH